jgi:hypothetical protein
MGVGTQSLIHDIAHQGDQQNIFRASESFLGQDKRFLADWIAVRSKDRLNPQILERGDFPSIAEKELQCSEKTGTPSCQGSQSFLQDRPIALGGAATEDCYRFPFECLIN